MGLIILTYLNGRVTSKVTPGKIFQCYITTSRYKGDLIRFLPFSKLPSQFEASPRQCKASSASLQASPLSVSFLRPLFPSPPFLSPLASLFCGALIFPSVSGTPEENERASLPSICGTLQPGVRKASDPSLPWHIITPRFPRTRLEKTRWEPTLPTTSGGAKARGSAVRSLRRPHMWWKPVSFGALRSLLRKCVDRCECF